MIISLKGGHPLQWFGIFLGYWCRFNINYLFIQQIFLYLIIFEKYFCSIVSNISREKRSITNWLVVNDVWCPPCVNISHQRRSPPSLISTLSSSSPVSSLHTQTDQWEASMESPDQTVDQSESCSCQTERWAQYFSILALYHQHLDQNHRRATTRLYQSSSLSSKTRTISVMNWFAIINIWSVKHGINCCLAGPSVHSKLPVK